MTLRIAINGFGRIGTVALRAILIEKYDVEVAAINTKGDLDIEAFANQFKYDSVYGRFPGKYHFPNRKKVVKSVVCVINDLSIPF